MFGFALRTFIMLGIVTTPPLSATSEHVSIHGPVLPLKPQKNRKYVFG